jgi:hypothetical protein
MAETLTQEKAYNFAIQADQGHGKVKVGRREFPVSIKRFSWAGYTIETSESFAKRLPPGQSANLTHQGNVYAVSCVSRERLEKGVVNIELRREDDEADRRRNKRNSSARAPKAFSLNQRDPVLGFAALMFVIVMFFMLPGWGGNWGTSDYLTKGVHALFTAVVDACKSIVG